MKNTPNMHQISQFSSKNLFAVFHIIIKNPPPPPPPQNLCVRQCWADRGQEDKYAAPPPPLFLLSSWVCLCISLAIHVVCPQLRNTRPPSLITNSFYIF